MTNSKEVILQKISQNKFPTSSTPTSDGTIYKSVGEDLLACFKLELETVNGHVVICESLTDALEKITQCIIEKNINKVFCTEELKSQLPHKNGSYILTSSMEENIQASVTFCESLMARTGSVLMSSALDSGRKATSFSPIHIVVAYNNQLVANIDDALTAMSQKYQKKMPSCMTIVTGPSRTADIEKTLVLGAHGPKTLIVFVIK